MIPDHIFSKHHDHEVKIDLNPHTRKGQPVRQHLAALRCITCDQHLKWMSGAELIALGCVTPDDLDSRQEIQRQKNVEWDNSPWL
jgi:hypothetical protein